MAKRIGLSNRKNIKKKNRRPFILAISAVIVSGLAFAIWNFTIFPLKEVVFIGNRHLRDAELKKLMGVSEGNDLLKLSCQRLANGLLSSAWIKSVSIRKEYPDRLLVRVVESEPFALFRGSGKLFIIDDTGRKLQELRGGSQPLLPIIVSDSFNVEPSSYFEALNLIKAIKDTPIASRPVEIVGVDSAKSNLSLLVDGTPVRIGEGRYDEKLLRFVELEKEVRRRWAKVEYIDLRFANRVVIKPLKEEVLQ